jgi:CRISPR-associated protein Cmr1
MQTFEYKLTFHTPAFLGNAEQAAQWRTPPIKALLRQWWRVVYAAEQRGRVDVGAMRQAEGRLFGVAADTRADSRKSQVRLRLDRWSEGSLKSWEGLEQPQVEHREVEKTGYKVGPHLYLGFGPLTIVAGKTGLTKGRAAIQANDSACLSLAVPYGAEGQRLLRALALMALYGTLGGRSRNGWGSFDLTPVNGTPALVRSLEADCVLPWRDALGSDWPQGIGSDGVKPLIWQTAVLPDWKQVMRRLAEIKINLRTQFVFTAGRDALRPEGRHWLSYPVTNHSVREWGSNARLPNTLRFKVRPSADGKRRYGVIFHMPCLPPPAFKPDRSAIERVWQQVHAHLDAEKSLTRIPA